MKRRIRLLRCSGFFLFFFLKGMYFLFFSERLRMGDTLAKTPTPSLSFGVGGLRVIGGVVLSLGYKCDVR